MDRSFFLKNLWLWKCGKPEINFEKEDMKELKKTQWSKKFEKLMRNRLLLGSFRYGKLSQKNKKNYDRIGYAIKVLKRYLLDKNKEYLVDAANLCLLEFEEGNGILKITDDSEHVPVK